MRRSGRTTRLIDKAIQTLFFYGEVKIASKEDIIENYNNEVVIMDHEMDEEGKNELFSKINKRLMNEHRYIKYKQDYDRSYIELSK